MNVSRPLTRSLTGGITRALTDLSPGGSKYGPELVINGTFAADLAGWSVYPTLGPGTFAWDAASGGRLRSNNLSVATRGLYGQNAANGMAVIAGKSYRVRATMVCASGVTPYVAVSRVDYNFPRLGVLSSGQAPGTVTFEQTWVAADTENVHFTVDHGNLVGDFYLDNVSLMLINY